jgi:hypothetical protein
MNNNPSPDELRIEADVRREKSQQNINNIRMLKECPAWDKYWIPRLQQIREDHHVKLLTGKLTYEEREIERLFVLEYDQLINQINIDEGASRKVLENS